MCDSIVKYGDNAITWNKHKQYSSVLAMKFPHPSALVSTLTPKTL